MNEHFLDNNSPQLLTRRQALTLISATALAFLTGCRGRESTLQPQTIEEMLAQATVYPCPSNFADVLDVRLPAIVGGDSERWTQLQLGDPTETKLTDILHKSPTMYTAPGTYLYLPAEAMALVPGLTDRGGDIFATLRCGPQEALHFTTEGSIAVLNFDNFPGEALYRSVNFEDRSDIGNVYVFQQLPSGLQK